MNNSSSAFFAILTKSWHAAALLLQPFAPRYPHLMVLRSRLIGWLV